MMGDEYFRCRCVFESDRTQPDVWANHLIPIDCRDEVFWRERSEWLSQMSADPKLIMEWYNEQMQEVERRQR